MGGEVRLLEADQDVYRMFDTPEQLGRMVHAEFKGSGDKKILLIAHMDTVYLRGMLANQPFRIDGNRAYGLGISDDKQGVALILHAVKMLRELGFARCGFFCRTNKSGQRFVNTGDQRYWCGDHVSKRTRIPRWRSAGTGTQRSL